MRLLLDTHTAAWFVQADPRLSETAREKISASDSEVLLSAVVAWEVAIKRALGKLSVDERYLRLLIDAGAEPLAITLDHASAVEHLPMHHRDPFDRLLIAQAQREDCAIVTDDAAFSDYDVTLIW